MKSVQGKLLKKLKSIKPVVYLKPDRVLQAFAVESFIDSYSKTPDPNEQLAPNSSEQPKLLFTKETDKENHQPEIIDVTELMKDLEAEDKEEESSSSEEKEVEEDKENVMPTMKQKVNHSRPQDSFPLSEIDVSCFRKPDLNSCTLFDPNLLAAFEQAVEEHMKMNEQERRTKIRRIEVEPDPLLEFEEKCPVGGDGVVVFYTTTLTGIRKTFEDCNKVMPPRLFIKGRYIGGAEQVLTLHEQGKLKVLFNGIPIDCSNGVCCEGCGGFRFVVCFVCNGSHRIVGDDGLSSRCFKCNENGLIICPLCC